MPTVSIYRELLDWSKSRPSWQQDALRRLVTQEQIDQDDITELASLCKAKHGLEDPKELKPLKKQHLPPNTAADSQIRLIHLIHHMGVNALAPNQTIEFGRNLTIIYGDNGAGKSGYVRILKRACRARGAEPILGNVTSGAPPPRPSAQIRYSSDQEGVDFSWHDSQDTDPLLSQVSVFDRHCASVYITKRTDVAFRPMGLDLFDKLAVISEEVKKVLDKERSNLEDQIAQLPKVPPNTSVASLLENLTALTEPEKVRTLSKLSDADLRREKEINIRIKDLTTNDPKSAAQTLSLRADLLSTFLERLKDVSTHLSETSIRDLFQARNISKKTKDAVDKQAKVFESMPVSGVGSARWRRLWDAAREFFDSEAYPGKPYPSRDALCVLCQQQHADDSFERMQVLERHNSSASQTNYEKADESYQSARIKVLEAAVGDIGAIKHIAIDNPDLAKDVTLFCEDLKGRHKSVLAALNKNAEFSTSFTVFDFSSLSNHIDSLRVRAKTITESRSADSLAELSSELKELEARHALRDSLDLVLAEIRRMQKIAAYQQCIGETRTNAITRRSTKLTKRVVTDRLIQAFSDELKRLSFQQVEVDLIDAGGSRGALYHKLRLKRAPSSDLAEVVSEGEARCLSIASFFAELSTADGQSAILFDDPVSSLDHTWRHSVAKRLAEESAIRQVVVFTHDLVFLHALLDEASRLEVKVDSCYLRRTNLGVGFSSNSLPTPALKVSARIGHLNNLWQEAESLFVQGKQDEYEQKGGVMYGILREAWERGVEEVLLCSVVERYRPSVQTLNKIMNLSDICKEDCQAVQDGMSKCSRFMHGHDQSHADNRPFPEPDEVKSDIDSLDIWIKAIRKRRK